MERRREERTETNVLLTCRVPARPCRVVMHDLSHTGCRLELPEMNAPLGATALLDLPGATQFPGRVVWIRGNVVGIRFLRPLRGPAAVELGIEAAPEPEPDLYPAAETSNLGGILRHWIRRLTGSF
jgi:hypothetical protein